MKKVYLEFMARTNDAIQKYSENAKFFLSSSVAPVFRHKIYWYVFVLCSVHSFVQFCSTWQTKWYIVDIEQPGTMESHAWFIPFSPSLSVHPPDTLSVSFILWGKECNCTIILIFSRLDVQTCNLLILSGTFPINLSPLVACTPSIYTRDYDIFIPVEMHQS